MAPRRNSSIYDEVVRLAHEYFGPDSARHIGKFVGIHLRKEPETMTKDELVSMIDWIKNEVSFMAEDKVMAERYIGDLMAITESNEV